MRLQMKEKPGAKINTHKTSIRSGGNLPSSLLRSASPHLGRAGDPRRRRAATQSSASSSGAARRRSAAAAVGRHPRADGRPSRDRETARDGRVAAALPPAALPRPPAALHSLGMAAGRAPAARCHPSPLPKYQPPRPLAARPLTSPKRRTFGAEGGRKFGAAPRGGEGTRGPPAPSAPRDAAPGAPRPVRISEGDARDAARTARLPPKRSRSRVSLRGGTGRLLFGPCALPEYPLAVGTGPAPLTPSCPSWERPCAAGYEFTERAGGGETCCKTGEAECVRVTVVCRSDGVWSSERFAEAY